MNGVILAAGLGTRLRPLTDDRPKALVEVAGASMLQHLICKMKSAGFTHIVVNVHYMGEQIIDFLKRNDSFGIKIDVSDERDLLLDTGGGIARALRFFEDEKPVLVHNVDVISDIDLGEIYSLAQGCDTLLLVQKRNSSRMLYFDDNMALAGWMNLKSGEKRSPFANFSPEKMAAYAFSGIHVINSAMARKMKEVEGAFPLIPFYLENAACMNVRATLFPEAGQWVDAGTPEALERAAEILKKQTLNNNTMNDLLKMLDSSPVNFLAIDYAEKLLNANGFKKVELGNIPALQPGDSYYITKNNSALFAFRVGTGSVTEGFKLICAHTDSPGFRIKPAPEMYSEGGMVRLNTEVYGGPILYTWFDRPLSIAGRVILRGESPLRPEIRLLHVKRPLLLIPHLAIHFNREVNDGNPINRQRDMMPVLGFINGHFEKENLLVKIIAEELDVDVKDILDFDVSLYDATPACLCGMNNEFVSCGRQDDLLMSFAGLQAMINSNSSSMTQVLALFDNEETGNVTKQGSASPVLRNLLDSIILNRGGKPGDLYGAVENSFMVSADMAHALHPNYADKHDPTNHPVMGGGPVIKFNANQKYVTDAESAAVFAEVCRKAGVPFQYFVNRSDIAGGGTLGNTLTTQLPMRGVDMGNPMWGMHSIRETSALVDTEYTIKAFTEFYNV